MLTTTVEETLLQKLQGISRFIGNTPLFPIKNIFQHNEVGIYAKLEWQQFGQSVKSRAAFNIIREAIQTDKLHSKKILIDATSGNTGIAYASIGAVIGIKVKLFLPENISEERKRLLKTLGAQIVYTSPFESTDGAQLEAKKEYESDPEKYFYADQYSNNNNWKAHYNSTAFEIYRQTNGEITHFVAGLGTTGTFTGTGKKLKELRPGINLIALQPDFPLHGLEGWKHLETVTIPGIYDNTLPDYELRVSTTEAYSLIRKVAKKEGLLLSPSSAANLAGAIRVANKIDKGIVVTVFPDNAEKYKEITNELYNN